MDTPSVQHSRRHRNKKARLSNALVGFTFLLIFVSSLISFCTFLLKQLEITGHTTYSNGTYGNCILYADWDQDSSISVHLGSSGLCWFVVYGELLVMAYSLVVFFLLILKVIIGCALMRCDLIVELLLNIGVIIFQFLIGIALTSGIKDTCDAVEEATPGNSCSKALLPPSTGKEFYGHLVTSVVFLWFSVVLLLVVIVFYLVAVNTCIHRRVRSRRGRGDVLVEEDNQMYSVESESELRETVH